MPDAVEAEPGVTAEEHPEPVQEQLTPMGNRRTAVTEADDVDYPLPKTAFLTRSKEQAEVHLEHRRAHRPSSWWRPSSHFGVESKIVGSVSGPHVTRYELRLAPGIKMSKVSNMRDDLAYALAADDVRILAPIPGKRAVGVEVPNRIRNMVHLGDVAQESPEGWSPLTVWLGKDIDGRAIGIDLASQPRVLVAGAPGSGKSGSSERHAGLDPDEGHAERGPAGAGGPQAGGAEPVRGRRVPHLLTPVITSPRLAANALQNLIKEMEERFSS